MQNLMNRIRTFNPGLGPQIQETVMKSNLLAILVAVMAIFTLGLPSTALAYDKKIEDWMKSPICTTSGIATMNFVCGTKHRGDQTCPDAIKKACKKKVPAPRTPYTACEGQQSWLPGTVTPPDNCSCPDNNTTKGKGTIAGKKNRPVCIAAGISDSCFVKNDGALGDDCKCDEGLTLNPATLSCDAANMEWWTYGEKPLPEGDPQLAIPNPDDTHAVGTGEGSHLVCDSDGTTKVVHPADSSICPEGGLWTALKAYFGSPSSAVNLGLILAILGFLVAIWNERRKWSCFHCNTENGANRKTCSRCDKPRPPKPGSPVPCPKNDKHSKGMPGKFCGECRSEYPKPEPVVSSGSSGVDREELRETAEATVQGMLPEAVAEALAPLLAALEAGDMALVAEAISKIKADSAELADAALSDDGDDNLG